MDDADFDMINELRRQAAERQITEEQRKKNEVASAAALEAYRTVLASDPTPEAGVRARDAGHAAARAFSPDGDAVNAGIDAVNAEIAAAQWRDREARVAERKAAQKAARAEKAAQKRAVAGAKPTRRG